MFCQLSTSLWSTLPKAKQGATLKKLKLEAFNHVSNKIYEAFRHFPLDTTHFKN